MIHLTDGEHEIERQTAQDAWDAMPADVQFWTLQEDEDRDADDYWLGVDESVAYAGYQVDRAGWEQARERMRVTTPSPVCAEGYPF